MEKRFTQPAPVLDEQGSPNPGWASEGLLQYSRAAIRAPFHRIKEWDWYQVSDSCVALQFTLGHASYAGQAGISMFNFAKGKRIYQNDKIMALPFGSLGLCASAEADGVTLYDKRDMWLRFEKRGDTRMLAARAKDFEAEITLVRQNPHALVVNVPFAGKPRHFYYNHKISCMSAIGRVVANGQEYTFGDNAWGLLDWGRGVWPFHNEWYWSSASGTLGGEVFGFNLGCGFGNTEHATENCLFYKDGMHKLGRVSIAHEADWMAPWQLRDEEGRLDLTLRPVYDRETKTKLLWVDNNTHQMFGAFEGYAILDDGTRLDIADFTGFAEHAVNNW